MTHFIREPRGGMEGVLYLWIPCLNSAFADERPSCLVLLGVRAPPCAFKSNSLPEKIESFLQ